MKKALANRNEDQHDSDLPEEGEVLDVIPAGLPLRQGNNSRL
jgi:hypothetical protein